MASLELVPEKINTSVDLDNTECCVFSKAWRERSVSFSVIFVVLAQVHCKVLFGHLPAINVYVRLDFIVSVVEESNICGNQLTGTWR